MGILKTWMGLFVDLILVGGCAGAEVIPRTLW
jgi:hypothetical protein